MPEGTLQDTKRSDRIAMEILDLLKQENLSIAAADDVLYRAGQVIKNMYSFIKIPDYKAFACPNCKSLDIITCSEPPPNFCGQCGQKDPFHLEEG